LQELELEEDEKDFISKEIRTFREAQKVKKFKQLLVTVCFVVVCSAEQN